MELIRKKAVSHKEDNKLKVISDARKMAISGDMVLSEEGHPQMSPKIEALCQNVFKEHQGSMGIKGTQLVFCDLGTPSGLKEHSVYNIIKDRLLELGMKPEEVAFIHDAKNSKQEERLFADVRDGSVRVLIGSTEKMGEGTNVQERLVASHDFDPPWRPKDVIQRRRRTIRQGNMNELVNMYVYTTKGSFDGYVWSALNIKNRSFGYIMSGKSVERSFELDLDPSFAQTYALVTGNPILLRQAEVENSLISLNAKRSALIKEYELIQKTIAFNESSIRENTLVGQRLETVQFINSVDGWSIHGMPLQRSDVLRDRYRDDIAFNGMKVTFDPNSKLWSTGGFSFKRPVDIEKQMDYDLDDKKEALSDANEQLNVSSQELEARLMSFDLTVYDSEIEDLAIELSSIEKQISMENEGLALSKD